MNLLEEEFSIVASPVVELVLLRRKGIARRLAS